jgi:hypothetical protein
MLPTPTATLYCACLTLLVALLSPAGAAEPAAQTAQEIAKDGSFVVDPHTKLLWQRCVEGMQWNGKTCTGEASRLSYAEAISASSARQKALGGDWRLPSAAELRTFVSAQGRDPMLFPAAPTEWYWTMTNNMRTGQINQYDYGNIQRGRTNENSLRIDLQHGWAVNASSGESRGDVLKRSKLPVRLVQSEHQ